jgi:hypothetical protein
VGVARVEGCAVGLLESNAGSLGLKCVLRHCLSLSCGESVFLLPRLHLDIE